MANPLINVQIQTTETVAGVADKLALEAGRAQEGMTRLAEYLVAIASGTKDGKVTLSIDSTTNVTKATATATCTQANVVEDDTVVVGGTTFTWKDSPSGESEVDIGATDALCATNLAAAITAHSTLAGIVSASAAAAVCTITAVLPGRAGNLITLAETGTGVVLSAAALAGATTAQNSAPREWTGGVA